jgi:hypothetical protein
MTRWLVTFHTPSTQLTESIRILNPILTVRRVYRSCIGVNVVESHVRSIHNVQAPQRWVLDIEVVHVDFGDIPENERHWTSRLCVAFFRGIPHVSIAVNSARAVSINGNVVAGDDEAGVVVLEGNWVGIVAPVIQVVGEL